MPPKRKHVKDFDKSEGGSSSAKRKRGNAKAQYYNNNNKKNPFDDGYKRDKQKDFQGYLDGVEEEWLSGNLKMIQDSKSNSVSASDSSTTSARNRLSTELSLPVELTPCQQRVIDAIKSGVKCIFVCGRPGTGKSFLIEYMTNKRNRVLPMGQNRTVVTASTGIAAVNINGSTVHSFAAIGLGDEPMHKIRAKLKFNKNYDLIRQLEVLILDEVSMVSADFFEKLDMVLKIIRGSDSPFGGVTLLLFGDFKQLPPVVKERFIANSDLFSNGNDDGSDEEKQKVYAFESNAWKNGGIQVISLQTVRRQRDPVFLNVLDEIRDGYCSDESERILQSRYGADLSALCPPDPKTGLRIEPTILYSHKARVDDENSLRLQQIRAPNVYYHARNFGTPKYLELLDKNCSAKVIVELKVGAQVMLLKNIDPSKGLVNGSRGVVIGFIEDTNDFERDKKHGGGSKLASVIHGANCISRMINDKIVSGWAGEHVLLPVVSFTGIHGVPSEPRVIHSEVWRITEGDEVKAQRKQVPLGLAWAITIHKCQGLSLDVVDMNLSSCFAAGQAYVALSRARSLEGIRLSAVFNKSKIKADRRALDFMAKYENNTPTMTPTTAIRNRDKNKKNGKNEKNFTNIVRGTNPQSIVSGIHQPNGAITSVAIDNRVPASTVSAAMDLLSVVSRPKNTSSLPLPLPLPTLTVSPYFAGAGK